jgi:uncharacterized protein (DUF342 family)
VSNERIAIRVTGDGMSALVSVAPGPPASAHDLAIALDRAGVCFGVDEHARRRLIDELGDPEFSVRELRLASGEPASPSRDACFEPAFEVGVQPGRLREDGSMDFFDRGLLKHALEGDVLGRVRPARPASPGTRVDGGSQPTSHLTARLPRLGAGVLLQKDGSVIATRSGTIAYVAEDSLEIVAQHVHRGDVDMRSGHLSMEGSLIIEGDVRRLFGVRALGDLEIRGVIEGGSVYAGGNMAIHGAVSGGDVGIVSAGGDLRARHVERSTLICGGAMTLEESVHSELTAETIHVLRWLHGGTATAALDITVEQVGSPRGNAATVLIAGVPLDPPELPAQPVIVQAKHEVVSVALHTSGPVTVSGLAMRASGAPARISAAPARISAAPARTSAAPGQTASTSRRPLGAASIAPQRASFGPAAGPSRRPVDEDAKHEAERKAAYQARAERLRSLASIRVLGVAHEGVTIQIGELRLVLERAVSDVCFAVDAKTGKIGTTPGRR